VIRVAAKDLQPYTGFGVPAAFENAESATTDLHSILGVLLRHWKLISVVPSVALVGTYIVLLCVPPQYKSTTEILIVNPKVQSETPVRATAGIPDAATMSTEIALIQSKSLALRVARELELHREPQFKKRAIMPQLLEKLGLSQMGERLGLTGRQGSEEAPAEAGSDPSNAALDEAAEELRERIQVERLGLSYVLSISITTTDPALSQSISDAVARNFFAEELDARSDARGRAAGWLKKWVSELRDSLSETEGEIEKIKAESGLSDTGLMVNVTEQQTSELNKQLTNVRAEVTEKKLRLEQARRLFEGGENIQAVPDIMASPVITKLRAQQSELKWREQELRDKFGDRHIEVIAVRAQLASINRQMSDEAQHIITNLQSTYDLALDRQRSLEESLRKLTTTDSSNNSAYVKLRALQPAADAKRKLFEQALGDLDELSRRAAADDEGGRVIAPASKPLPANALRRMMIYGIVGVFAAGVGAVLAFLVEYLQSGFRTHEMVERTLGYPVLSMIPAVRRRLKRVSSELLVEDLMREQRSQLSTSVETARIVLGFSSGGAAPKVLLLTSALPGEGKSTVARLLATSSALSGRRTALVDCDLHHGSVSKPFGRKRSGIAEVLAREADLEAVTIQDPNTGLFVIPAGAAAKGPADLLGSPLMRDLVDKLRERYDYVVIDASPLLAVVDALTLASVADKIVMVVEWGRTARTSVAEALKALKYTGHSIAGVVLNKVDYKRLASSGYGFGRDYNYGSRFRAIGKY
jgi:capsular exopolysaccharide synthesis family protein